MFPSPPLTVPDAPISGIRFFTGELRSQQCTIGRPYWDGVLHHAGMILRREN